MTTCILADNTNFPEATASIFIVGHTGSTYLGNFSTIYHIIWWHNIE